MVRGRGAKEADLSGENLIQPLSAQFEWKEAESASHHLILIGFLTFGSNSTSDDESDMLKTFESPQFVLLKIQK